MNKREIIKEGIATDILSYHVGTPHNSYGSAKRPQPDWCKESRCEFYKEDCEYCITDIILSYLHSQGIRLPDGSSLIKEKDC